MFRRKDPSRGAAETGVASALYAMALVTRMNGLRVDTATLVHRFGHVKRMGALSLVSALRDIGMKARLVRVSRSGLRKLPLPAIAELKDRRFAVLQSVGRESVQWHPPGGKGSETIPVKDFTRQASGRVILAYPAETSAVGSPGGPREKFGLPWFLRTLFKYGAVMREVLLASVFIQLFALATPLVFMTVIDKVFAHNNLSTLDVLVFGLVVVSLFDILLGGVRTYLVSHTSNRADVELGRRLFRHLMLLPLSYFESRQSGDTIARIRELESVRGFLTGSTLTLLIDVLFVGLFVAVMFLFSPLLAGIVLASLPLFFLVSLVLTPLMRRRLEDRHQCAAENQAFLVETLGGIEAIKSAAAEPRQQHAFEEKLAAHARAATGGAHLSNLVNQVVALLGKGLTVALLYVGARLVLTGALTVGELIAFNMLSGRVIAPVQRLAQLWQDLTGVRVSLRRLSDIMDAVQEPGRVDGTTMPEFTGHVRFEAVGFRYDDTRPPVLTDVSFKVEPGELIGIVGPTGAGKTTLAKLMQRLYTPSSGRIFVDGINLQAMDPARLRRQIGVVAQEFVLFNRTIRENITLGDADIDDERVIEVARLCGAHQVIAELPDGYDTLLSERGRGLSTGQRQAIALARALATDPALLILDEATSAFDDALEQRFHDNLASIRRGRTTFIIAHRATTLRGVDRVFRLEHGRLVDDRAQPVVRLRPPDTGNDQSTGAAIHATA